MVMVGSCGGTISGTSASPVSSLVFLFSMHGCE